MSAEQSNQLTKALDRLMNSTCRLSEGLMRADAQAIFLAVMEQVESMRDLNACNLGQLPEAERDVVGQKIRHILDVNALNQDLSRNGLRALRQSLVRFLPSTSYQKDGTVQLFEYESRLSTSA